MIAKPVVIDRHDMAALRQDMMAARSSLLRRPSGLPYWMAVTVTGALTVCAAAALAYRLTTPTHLADWGYTAATAAFLVSSVQAAPALAAIARLTRGYWAVSVHRVADLMALAGFVSVPVVLMLLSELPPWKGRPSIWFDLVTAPQAPDAAAIVLLAFAGLAILRLSAAPARGGTPKNWESIQLGLVLLGSFYIALLVYVDMLVISDLSVSLVNGWHSSDMPVYQAFTGFEGALATVIVTLACLRRFGGLSAYIKEDVFKALSKLLLAFALLFIWFFWSEFLTFWYGRLPDEKDLMTLFMFGSYLVPFAIAMVCNFLLPVALLIWASMRASVAATTAVAVVVLIGNFADRVRLYVPSWSLAGPIAAHFGAQPPTRLPDVADLLIVAGCPTAVVFLILLALRFVPAIALWEHQRDLLLRFERPFAKATMPVVAKVD